MVGLAVKFLWPLLVFDVPLGYDPGFYRYLFVRHADAWPPFILPSLDPWARGHPLGLFFFTSLLIKIGVPVDWLLGWIWNCVPMVLGGTYAWIMRRRYDAAIGLLTLLTVVLSVAFFDGFAAMYWKTYVALFWMILAFDALERRTWHSLPYGILTVATHHQTGLLFGLTFVTWVGMTWMTGIMHRFGTCDQDGTFSSAQIAKMITFGVLILLAGAATYAPIWQDAVLVHIPALLDRSQAAAGSFPPPLFYLQTSGILIVLGVTGWWITVRHARWTLWQIAFLWSAAFVLLRLFFYRRFLLQMDFFLLPFAAIGMRWAWDRHRVTAVRAVLVIAVVAQLITTILVMRTRGPLLDPTTYAAVQRVPDMVPVESFILSIDNQSVVLLRGWLPYHRVGGPGLFDAPWSYEEWERFLLGSAAERQAFLTMLPASTYLFVADYARSFYGAPVETLLRDPCLVPVEEPFLYRVSCPVPSVSDV